MLFASFELLQGQGDYIDYGFIPVMQYLKNYKTTNLTIGVAQKFSKNHRYLENCFMKTYLYNVKTQQFFRIFRKNLEIFFKIQH